MLSSGIYYAQQGIRSNMQLFADAAEKIASPDKVASFKEITDLKKAQTGVKVNVAVLRTANDMQGSLVDLLL